MHCPKCGADTEVVRKVNEYRLRRCVNPLCKSDDGARNEFATREDAVSAREFRRIRSRSSSGSGGQNSIYLEILATGSQEVRSAS